MDKAGIQRINITNNTDGRGGWRFSESSQRQPAADKIYQAVFDLNPGVETISVDKVEYAAGYDYDLGIDVFLNFKTGLTMTLQEKYLFTKYRTVTVEYYQNQQTKEQGDWFKLRCQYYFVGYDRTDTLDFQEWVLLNWPAVQQATNEGRINWRDQVNKFDGARASFRFVDFGQIPDDCIISAHFNNYNPWSQSSLLTTQRAST